MDEQRAPFPNDATTAVRYPPYAAPPGAPAAATARRTSAAAAVPATRRPRASRRSRPRLLVATAPAVAPVAWPPAAPASRSATTGRRRRGHDAPGGYGGWPGPR